MNKSLYPATIFFDLDGTLFASHDRLFKLFCYLAPKSTLDFNMYWSLKRKQKSHSYILENYLKFSEDQIVDFEKKWLVEIEKESWLLFDKPFDWVNLFLKDLYSSYNIYIVTDRQSKDKAVSQILQYEWNIWVKDIIVTEKKAKKSEMLENIQFDPEKSWFIGDTGIDIQTGKIIGVKTVGVLSGFRNIESLKKYNPDIIVEKAVDLRSILLKNMKR